MKKYLNKGLWLFNAICFCFLISSCDTHFLDELPEDRLTIDQVFERQDLSEEYLAHIYSHLDTWYWTPTGNPWEGLSDEEDITYNRPGNSQYATFQMNLGAWQPASFYYNTWPEYYEGIRSANYFIGHIKSNKQLLNQSSGRELINQYIAEAKFLKALFYFSLLRQYGPIPVLQIG